MPHFTAKRNLALAEANFERAYVAGASEFELAHTYTRLEQARFQEACERDGRLCAAIAKLAEREYAPST